MNKSLSLPKVYELTQCYLNSHQLSKLEAFAQAFGYNLNKKQEVINRVVDNKNITITRFYDLIVEKQLKSGKKKHAYIQVNNKKICLVMFKKIVKESFVQSTVIVEDITKLLDNDVSKMNNQFAKALMEPEVFIEFNK